MIVNTKYGPLQGTVQDGWQAFLGVPFAKAPIGELRFQPPQPLEAWEGTFDATKFPPCSIQAPNRDVEGMITSEDCLYLNIWTPAVNDGKKRPVVVHVHGGGYTAGSAQQKDFDGPHFAPNKDIVFVAIQYRLGALGFLYLGGVLGEKYRSSGSCGTLDQVAALQWIHDNIADFGGDPDDVTLMGESAGGRSVSAMMTTPASKGLFHKVILQSGSIQSVRDVRTAEAITERYLGELNLDDPSDILTLPAEQILEVQNKLNAIYSSHMFGSVIDGVNMFVRPEQYLLDGNLKDVPFLVGANHDEMRFPIPEERLTPEFVEASLEKFGENAAHVRSVYERLVPEMGVVGAYGEVMTQYVYLNASAVLASILTQAGNTTWLYRWDHTGNRLPIAHHFSEMAYIFRQPGNFPENEENQELSDLMNAIWTSFITKADPNVPGLPEWKPFCGNMAGERMYLSTNPEVKPFDLEQDCDHEMPIQVIILK